MDWTIGPLDHWTLGLLDYFLDHFWTIFFTSFWTFLWTNFEPSLIWTILSRGGRQLVPREELQESLFSDTQFFSYLIQLSHA